MRAIRLDITTHRDLLADARSGTPVEVLAEVHCVSLVTARRYVAHIPEAHKDDLQKRRVALVLEGIDAGKSARMISDGHGIPLGTVARVFDAIRRENRLEGREARARALDELSEKARARAERKAARAARIAARKARSAEKRKARVERDAKAVELYRQGVPVDDIGEAAGMSNGRVCDLARAAGVPPRRVIAKRRTS